MNADLKIPEALMLVGFLSGVEVEGEELTWSPETAPILAVGDDMRTLYIIGDAVEKMDVVDAGDQSQLIAAKWAGFSGRAYDGIVGAVAIELPDAVEHIGHVQAVSYVAPRDMGEGEWSLFRHKFAHSDAPDLMLGNDGNLWFYGGGYRFTTRGIVDDSDTAHANVV